MLRPRTPVPILRHPYLVHLRLGFNLLLTPIYLWGVLLAGGSLLDPRFWLGFLSLHLFLYGGTTAFNSFYDRDEGPVGGLLRPPPVDPGLLRFSLVVQALGLVPAAFVGPGFLLAWLALFLVFTAYSHPAVRLKSRPGPAFAAIALGQGSLGFACGWLAVAPAGGLWAAFGVTGLLSTPLVVAGLYLVTQSYQAAEDRERGDVSLAVLLGTRVSLLWGLLPLAAGGAGVVAWAWNAEGWCWALALGAFFAALGTWLVHWALHFDESQVDDNYQRAMGFTRTASLGLTLFMLIHLI